MVAALSWLNRVTAAATVSIGGTATSHTNDPAYPLTNLTGTDPTAEARATIVEDAVSSGQYIRTQWATADTVRVVGFPTVYISDLAALVSLQPRAMLAGALAANGDLFTAADLVPVPRKPGYYKVASVLAADVSADAVDLVITVAASQTLTYGVAAAWGGPALVVPAFSKGWSVKPDDGSAVERGPGGGYAAMRRPVCKIFTGSLDARTYETILGTPGSPEAANLLAASWEAGIGSPVFVIPRSDDLHTIQVASVYGLLAGLPEPTHQAGQLFRGAFRVHEVR